MLPELFTIPLLNLPVHTYGALYVTGLLVGLFVAYRFALLDGKYQMDVYDVGFWALIGALIGGRILYIIVEWDYYFVSAPFTKLDLLPFSIPTFLVLWKGGFVYFGGMIGGIVSIFMFCKTRKLPPWQFFDFIAIGLPLGHAIGRMGCVAGGCCYGFADYHVDHLGHVAANNPFSFWFPPGSIAYNSLSHSADVHTQSLMSKLGTTLPLFPVQSVEALLNCLIFFILAFFFIRKRAHGQVTLLYLVLYSLMRIFTETLRGDSARGFVVENFISTSQFISLSIIVVSIFFIIKLSNKTKNLKPISL